MLDNGRPLPDNDLLDDKNTKYGYSIYLQERLCDHCGWFQGPYPTPIQFTVCPE